MSGTGRRRLWVGRWFMLGLVAIAAVGALLLLDPFSLLTDGAETDAQPARERAEISLSALTGTIETDGELVTSTNRTIAAGVSGTVTSVAAAGEPIDASSVLFEVDGRPTVALVGDVPAWRTMSVGDVGADIEQLEANLVALGYDPAAELSVDDSFTDYTAIVVERWQADLGLDATGSVALGTVEFVPDQAVVSSALVGRGDTVGAGASVIIASSTDRHLDFVVEAQHLDAIEVGTEVSARLPDRTALTASVDEVHPAGDGTWSATAILGDDGVGDIEDGIIPLGEAVPVTVSWTEVVAAETTTVPTGALTRLDTGAYVLEVVDGDATRLVEVEIGPASGSTIAIITELAPGTVVIAP